MNTGLPRPEYPRPQFVRRDWLNLNGTWDFDFDDRKRGLAEKWFEQHEFSRTITVPFAFQSLLSGIADTDFHDVIWYARTFEVPQDWRGQRVLLHFGAVDFAAQVWVNGISVAYHEGGHTPFHADITDALIPGVNRVVVRVEDDSEDLEQPRGKQFWERHSKGIFYTRTSGIWQTVWLEPVRESYIETIKFTPDVDSATMKVEYRIANGAPNMRIEVVASYDGVVIAQDQGQIERLPFKAFRTLHGLDRLWSPEDPNLYDVTIRLKDGSRVLDEVQSYCGMRKIAVVDGQIELNNRPYYMKLVLDQGYFPEGLLTPPSDQAIINDIQITKDMGFNGARKHQKIEDPRYLYWADQMGLLVWGEMANSQTYGERGVQHIMAEWQAAVERDYNHPCIVMWVPLNESWGVPRLRTDSRQPHHAMALYHLTKSIDPTRLVISNDGWEHVKSDLCTIHDYEADAAIVRERYSRVDNVLASFYSERPAYVPGFKHHDQPIFVSEFGGIAYKKSDWDGWGYIAAANDDHFIDAYRSAITALLESPLVKGFCYTQLTDVEQEINGLLTYDRRPKVDVAAIRAINEGMGVPVLAGDR
ncbi:MAG: glycoside hydrolase family 2 [Anaerolineae bacterium]|nr:glycoside hydrolase family 2 [Anaerolineae bacterium]